MNTRGLFSFVSTLTGVTRFSMLKMCHQENVLEHTGMVAVFAYVVGNHVNQAAEELHERVSMELLLSKALVHDFDESITGDVARPTKYFSDTLREEMKKLEMTGLDQINEILQVDTLIMDHEQAKDGREGFIVRICDLAGSIHKIWEEVLVYNNFHFTLPAQRARKFLHQTYKYIPQEQFTKKQWLVLDGFVLDLNGILNKIINIKNGELMEIHSAN